MKVIDLTHVIEENMPVYPGTETPRLEPANTYEKDGFKETRLSMFSHTGTHMDPPAHLFPQRTTLDCFPPEQFIGKAIVIDCRDLSEGESITMDYIINGKYKGIGFDVIGLDPIADVNLTRHKKLFAEKEIVNIEKLCHLEQCGSGLFWFSCFPLKIKDSDGSPIRAIAWFE